MNLYINNLPSSDLAAKSTVVFSETVLCLEKKHGGKNRGTLRKLLNCVINEITVLIAATVMSSIDVRMAVLKCDLRPSSSWFYKARNDHVEMCLELPWI